MFRVWTLFLAFSFIPALTMAQAPLKTEEDRVLYTLGVQIMMDLAPFQLTPRDLKYIHAGMKASMKGELALDPNQFRDKIQSFGQKRVEKRSNAEKKRGADYVAKAKTQPEAEVP